MRPERSDGTRQGFTPKTVNREKIGQSDKIDADYISFGLKDGYPIFRYALCITRLNHLFLLYKHSIHPSQGDCFDIN